jgi:hypothetical protein
LQQVLRLVVVGVAQIRGPAHVAVHFRQHLGERCQRLHARVPVLGVGASCNLFGRRIALCLPPPVSIRHLPRVCRCGQHLGHEGVRIKRDRRHQLLQLRGTKRLGLNLRRCNTLLLRIWLLSVRLLLWVRLLLLVRLLLAVGLLLRIWLLSVGLLLWVGLLRIGLLLVGLWLLIVRLPVAGLIGRVWTVGRLLSEEFYLSQRQQQESHGQCDETSECLRYSFTTRAGRGARCVQEGSEFHFFYLGPIRGRVAYVDTNSRR